MTSETTPIRKQYLDIKKQYPDAIVFFRLGDFYETFDEDAKITSKELDIVLTSRNVSKKQRVPMAGIPYHAVDNYLGKLIDKGYHVAICEQMGDPPAKGLVNRKVVRVITPGTIIESELLQGSQNNYLASIVSDEKGFGLAYADITTGEFRTTQIQSEKGNLVAFNELNRLNPAELLTDGQIQINGTLKTHHTKLPAWKFDLRNSEEILKKHFRVATMDGFGLRLKPLAIRAAGAILQYLQDTQISASKMLNTISLYSILDFMVLDQSTYRNLEITETLRGGKRKGSLLSIIDQTLTPMGARLLQQWLTHPLLDKERIEERYDAADFFIKQGLLRHELREKLNSISDLERLTNRILSGNAIPRDLVSVRETIREIPKIHELFAAKEDSGPRNQLLTLHECREELKLLQTSLTDNPPATLQTNGVIRQGYSSELDQLIESSQHARDWIANLEGLERERTGIKTLKVGFNKVFGYYIEITRSQSGAAPDEYIRKQTLVNAERYITPELKEYESLVLNAEEQIHEVEVRIFKQIVAELAKSANRLLESARSLAELDVFSSLAETAARNNYIRPKITEDTILEIVDARHPVVEHSLTEKRFVPNDLIFEEGEIIRIITGPNMSGKSTFLRQAALIVLMAQIGSFIPASQAKIGLVDKIFTRIGAQDEIHAGQSTFMVEMVETANILNNATSRSLIILDEIGRGTSTYDGVSIAWAVVEYLHNHPKLKARTLFATHYHELMALSQILPGVKNYNVAVTESEGKVVFLHKIVPGGSDKSYGIHVGELAGLPQPVIRRAAEILKNLENTSGKTTRIDMDPALQMSLFPETNPLVSELKKLDMNTITPIQALNLLYDWKKHFGDEMKPEE
jgi:DNA mismatch repair protein MutS